MITCLKNLTLVTLCRIPEKKRKMHKKIYCVVNAKIRIFIHEASV